MAIKINGTNVINNARQLENITNLKTVNGQEILGIGDVITSDYVMRVYTSDAIWEKPNNLKSVKVTVVGGGGSSGNNSSAAITWPGGGAGGVAIKYIDAPAILSPVPVTVGAGGNYLDTSVLSGGTSSFGAQASATGGVTGRQGGAGGVASGGNVNMPGSPGGATTIFGGLSTTSTSPGFIAPGFPTNPPTTTTLYHRVGYAGEGGSTILGQGARARILFFSGSPGVNPAVATFNGTEGTGFGAGAGGQLQAPTTGNTVGANGRPGLVIVEEFY